MRSLLPCVLLGLLGVLALVWQGEARLCYNCTGDCVRDSECKGSCTTTVEETGGGDEVRSCINETRSEEKCEAKKKDGKRYKVCYCNTDRCNSSSRMGPSLAPFVLVAFLLLELR